MTRLPRFAVVVNFMKNSITTNAVEKVTMILQSQSAAVLQTTTLSDEVFRVPVLAYCNAVEFT